MLLGDKTKLIFDTSAGFESIYQHLESPAAPAFEGQTLLTINNPSPYHLGYFEDKTVFSKFVAILSAYPTYQFYECQLHVDSISAGPLLVGACSAHVAVAPKPPAREACSNFLDPWYVSTSLSRTRPEEKSQASSPQPCCRYIP